MVKHYPAVTPPMSTLVTNGCGGGADNKKEMRAHFRSSDVTIDEVIIEREELSPELAEVTVIYVKYPEDFCPKSCRCKYACWAAFIKTTVGRKWWSLRCYTSVLVDHRYFETFIIVMILASSIALVRIIMSLLHVCAYCD